MKVHNHLCFIIIVEYILRNSKSDQVINLNESNKIFSISVYIINLSFERHQQGDIFGSKLTGKLENWGYGGLIRHGWGWERRLKEERNKTVN